MNSVKSLFSHQLGFTRWTRYDAVLNRLICDKASEFDSIFPSGMDVEETPIFACKFSLSEGSTNLLALANEFGSVAVVDTGNGRYTRSGGDAHNNAIFDIAWLPKTLKLLTASGDHSAALLDLANGDFRVDRQFVGHTRSLKTVACCEDNTSIFATGGRDGKINVWDIRVKTRHLPTSTPTLSIPYSHLQASQMKDGNRFKSVQVSPANSVTGLIFHDINTLISCGAGDGVIKVWDMRKTYYATNRAPSPKYSLPYAGDTFKNGFSHLAIDYHRNILYASCLDSFIYAYNINTFNPEPIRRYYGHQNRTFYVKMCLGEEGEYIMSGSSDSNAYIWHRSKSTPLVRLVGHEEEVTGVGWNVDNNRLLVTCSDDLSHKFWKFSEKELTDDNQKVREYSGYAEAILTCIEPEVDKCEEEKAKILFEGADYSSLCLQAEILFDNAYSSFCHCLEFKELPCFCFQEPKPTDVSEDMTSDSNESPQPTFFSTNSNSTGNKETNSTGDKETNPRKRPLEAIDLNLPSTSKILNGNNDAGTSTSVEKKPRVDEVGTLLSDLPNFLVDGKAPHLNVSPVKHHEQDWLTKLRLQKKMPNIGELSSPSSPSTEKPSTKPSSTKKSNESHSDSPLLRYFKITNSPTSNRAKSPNVSLSSTSRTTSD